MKVNAGWAIDFCERDGDVDPHTQQGGTHMVSSTRVPTESRPARCLQQQIAAGHLDVVQQIGVEYTRQSSPMKLMVRGVDGDTAGGAGVRCGARSWRFSVGVKKRR